MGAPCELGTGPACAAVWFWPTRMVQHSDKSPLRLVTVSLMIGGVCGLVVAGSNAVALLSRMFDVALRESAQTMVGDPWWASAVKALVWMLGGALIWWWCWSGLGARRITTTFAAIAFVLVGVLGASLLALGGLSSRIIGGPVWWIAWRPTASVEPRERASTRSRIYLITVFVLSAIALIITLLIIGSHVFEFVLEPVFADNLVDRVRAPLGVPVATTLVAGYHFGLWRNDRAAPAKDALARIRTIAPSLSSSGGQPVTAPGSRVGRCPARRDRGAGGGVARCGAGGGIRRRTRPCPSTPA